MAIYFDDSLPLLADVIAGELGDEALKRGVALRDTSGRLCFFAAEELSAMRRSTLTEALTKRLEAYARPDRVIADPSEFGTKDTLESADAILVDTGRWKVRLIDRRLVGADWLRGPTPVASGPARFVFASIKGGVGRSTALSVVASDAAARGQRVLAVDLDLEAPGLGSMLLDEDAVPPFGMVDALVEGALAPLSPRFLRDLVAPSNLTKRGRIDILPGFGERSLIEPGEVLAKLARAYSESIRPDGSPASVLDRVADTIDRVASAERYDLVLIDARAGLHETAASALLGLGAEVLCFGLDQPQTFQGYRALFTHMRRYAKDRTAERNWLSRLSLVHAKAPISADLRGDFAQRFAKLVVGTDAKAESSLSSEVRLPEGFGDVPWDDQITDAELGLTGDQIEPEVLAILHDDNFINFDPQQRRDQISDKIYIATFGALLTHVRQVVEGSEPQP